MRRRRTFERCGIDEGLVNAPSHGQLDLEVWRMSECGLGELGDDSLSSSKWLIRRETERMACVQSTIVSG